MAAPTNGSAMLARLAGRTWRAATNPARTRQQLDVLRDYLLFERRHGRVLRSVQAPADAPRLLIVSLSDWPHQLKLEGMLAKALELKGYAPVVLTARWTRWAERYLRTFGIERFVYADDYIPADADALVEPVVRQALDGPLTVQRLKPLEFRGAHVGVHALASVSRTFQQGRISLEDPRVRAVLEDTLREAVRSVLGAEELLADVRPELVMFLEKGYAGFGSVYDVALDRGLNVFQWVASGIHWRDALLFKRYTRETRRFHPASLAEDTWAWVRELEWTPERERALDEEFALRYGEGEKHPDAGLQEGKRIKSSEQVRAQLGVRPGRKLAVVFSHILWDANMFFGEDLFEDQETWLVETVRAACANPQLDWVVKLHPANMYKAGVGSTLNDELAIREAVGKLPEHVRLLRPETDLNTYSLFGVADAGITIRGTIGLELPCFGVPVLTAGTGRYSGRGFTVDSATADEYLGRLARLHELPPMTDDEQLLAKRHAYALFRLRPCRFSSFENHYGPTAKLGHPLGQNLEVTVRSADGLRRAEDLHRFGDWAVDRPKLDYLHGL